MTEPSSKNFPAAELRCKCQFCKGDKPNNVDPDALLLLQTIRDTVGFPMHLSSAYRCADHPAESRKDTPGQHNKGVAFDVSISAGWKRMAIMQAAFDVGISGFGWANTFVHVDFRESRATCWSYS